MAKYILSKHFPYFFIISLNISATSSGGFPKTPHPKAPNTILVCPYHLSVKIIITNHHIFYRKCIDYDDYLIPTDKNIKSNAKYFKLCIT